MNQLSLLLLFLEGQFSLCIFGKTWNLAVLHINTFEPVSYFSRFIFQASASSSFSLNIFGEGMKSRFLFGSLNVSEKNECFDKFKTSLDELDPYLILFLKNILLDNSIYNCLRYANGVSTVCWMNVRTFISSMLLLVWSPDVEAIWTFFRFFPVMLLARHCFNSLISFFSFSISQSIGLASYLVLVVCLNFPQPCYSFLGLNVFSLLRSV